MTLQQFIDRYNLTLQQFIDRHNLILTATRTDRNPAWPDFDGDHWRVGLKRLGHKMTLVFSKGYGHKGAPPIAEEVLECLCSDACTDGDTFEEFCFSLGYDSDSRKAEKTYKAVQRHTDKLRRFLGADLFTELLQTEED